MEEVLIYLKDYGPAYGLITYITLKILPRVTKILDLYIERKKTELWKRGNDNNG